MYMRLAGLPTPGARMKYMTPVLSLLLAECPVLITDSMSERFVAQLDSA